MQKPTGIPLDGFKKQRFPYVSLLGHPTDMGLVHPRHSGLGAHLAEAWDKISLG